MVNTCTSPAINGRCTENCGPFLPMLDFAGAQVESVQD